MHKEVHYMKRGIPRNLFGISKNKDIKTEGRNEDLYVVK